MGVTQQQCPCLGSRDSVSPVCLSPPPRAEGARPGKHSIHPQPGHGEPLSLAHGAASSLQEEAGAGGGRDALTHSKCSASRSASAWCPQHRLAGASAWEHQGPMCYVPSLPPTCHQPQLQVRQPRNRGRREEGFLVPWLTELRGSRQSSCLSDGETVHGPLESPGPASRLRGLSTGVTLRTPSCP